MALSKSEYKIGNHFSLACFLKWYYKYNGEHMCGIFAYCGDKNNAAELVIDGIKKLEYRGYDSWGIAIKSAKSGKIEIEKHVGKIGVAKTSLPEGTLAIGHTRWATHGGVTELNSHPHLSTSGGIAIVHNGIVENFRDLRLQLIEKGYTFNSETDSEVIAHLIEDERTRCKDFIMAVMHTMNQLVGSNALVAMNRDTEEIVACRDGSPIVLGVGDSEKIIASDIVPILPFTNRCYFVQDGETIQISKDCARCFDTKTQKEKELPLQTVDIAQTDAEKNEYPHYMLKEIMDQITTINQSLVKTQLVSNKIFEMIKDKEIVFTGCGTAYHCAIYGTYLAATIGMNSRAIPANEFEPFAKTMNKNSVLIAISQSGETADTILAVKAAKKAGAQTLSIVNVSHSTLARLTDEVVNVLAGPELAVVSTKAFTAQAAALHTLFKQSENKNLTKLLKKWLNQHLIDESYATARILVEASDIFVIGKHALYPIALETALKIKEASYIHAEGFAAGELKHGVIALIEKRTPCIVLDDGGQYTPEVISSAIQLKSRGGVIIGVSPKKNEAFDIWVRVPEAGVYTPLLCAIVGQLLGYAASIGRGCDPDKPRNLAKSVTVK